MKNNYITIKEASKYTGKHPDTIRTLARKNRGSDHIISDNKGRVLISSELLKQTYPMTSPEPLEQLDIEKELQFVTPDKRNQQTASNQGSERASEHSELIKALTDQLKAKDNQIEHLTATVSKALDQQQQLSGLLLKATNEPVAPSKQVKQTVKGTTQQENVPTTKQVKKPITKQSVKIKRRGWFKRKK